MKNLDGAAYSYSKRMVGAVIAAVLIIAVQAYSPASYEVSRTASQDNSHLASYSLSACEIADTYAVSED